MCVYFATGEVSTNRNYPPSTNFASRGRRAPRNLKEWTLFSLGTDPEMQDNIEQNVKPGRVTDRQGQIWVGRGGSGPDALGAKDTGATAALAPEHLSPKHTLNMVTVRINAHDRLAPVCSGGRGGRN